MRLRTTLTTAWALVTGLAGGWLILSPWAFAEQPSGEAWTSVTQAAVFTGLGLVALAVIGLVAVIVQVRGGLRAAGVIAPRAALAPAASSPELEPALVALAQALAADLSAPGSSGVRSE